MKSVNAVHSSKAAGGSGVFPAFSPNVPRLSFLFPGYPQWTGGRRTRGAVMAGLYLASMATVLLLWGNPATWFFLLASIFFQAFSWVDAVRQNPFSGLTPTPVLAVTGGGLSLALHAPIFGTLTLIAWPSYGPDPQDGSYLVNRLAYKDRLPAPGQWVWLDGSTPEIQSAVRVVAVPGQLVVYDGKHCLVDENEAVVKIPAGGRRWEFRVPSNHVLIDPGSNVRPGEMRSQFVLVEVDHIAGRVWARCTPFWERGIL
ncbi:hypothetical protein [Paludisphaera rhizosphaerae]|uniref:hypothetical protein n=1 Tax=Paludisphaera rhizosphaerae TaxID=2711216 RepID=UPI0013EA771B|nr:hypothetical protein [Paludisphaera rhizosphaerae]